MVYHYHFIYLFALAIYHVKALPQPGELLESRAACGPSFKRAKFDDIATEPHFQLIPGEINDQPIAAYQGLNWDLYAYELFPIERVGVKAETPPNVAALDRVKDRVERRPHFVTTLTQNGTFQLNTLYFGCVSTEAPTVAPCHLTITGIAKDGTEVGSQELEFPPGLDPGYDNPMIQIYPTFAKKPIHALKLTPSGLVSETINYIFDSFAYTPCS